MQPPLNIDPEVLRRIIEQYQTQSQVPSSIEPQGYPSYTTMGSPTYAPPLKPPLTTQPQFNPNQFGFTQPQNLEELNELMRAGKINKDQYEQLFTQMPEYSYRNSTNQGVMMDSEQYSAPTNPPDYSKLFGNFGAGVSLESSLFNIGRYAGMDSDVSGRNLGLAGSIGKTLFGGARTLASGIGFSKKNEFVKDYYKDQQKDVNYTPAPQYQNNNYMGGYSYGKQGGEMTNGSFQDNTQITDNFNGYKKGDYIEFEYGGKVEKGTIDRIENGQIFLK